MKNLISLLIMATLFNGCKKDDKAAPIDQLPSATHTGANTFGCLINGEAFTVTGKQYLGSSGGVFGFPANNALWVVEGQIGHKFVRIEYDYLASPGVPKIFALAKFPSSHGLYINYDDATIPDNSNSYATDSTYTGSITVTDCTSTYVAGTFAFDVINGNQRIVHITDGRFDIQF